MSQPVYVCSGAEQPTFGKLKSLVGSRFKRLQYDDQNSDDDSEGEDAEAEQLELIDLDEVESKTSYVAAGSSASVQPERPVSPTPASPSQSPESTSLAPPSPASSSSPRPQSPPSPEPEDRSGGMSGQYYLADPRRAEADEESDQRWTGRRRGLRGYGRQRGGATVGVVSEQIMLDCLIIHRSVCSHTL